ncbi:MAG: hypothetical protein ACR2JY_12400 [Chloroflexota bacterium]
MTEVTAVPNEDWPMAATLPEVVHPDAGSSDLAVAVRLLRSQSRAIQQAQLAGFLSVCRAHPLGSAALDYVERKQEQAERSEQRLEQQFWAQVRALLLDFRFDSGDERSDRAAGRRATVLAQHLVAENLLRLAFAEDVQRSGAPRRGPGPRPVPAVRTGGERD